MLASPVPSGGRFPTDAHVWAFEVKWDGMRALVGARVGRGVGDDGLRVTTRTGRDVAAAFPELRGVLGAAAGRGVLLDGELVVLRAGVPSFAALAERFGVVDERRARALAVSAPVRFVVFDVLRCDGRDLTSLPWRARRHVLDDVSAGSAGGTGGTGTVGSAGSSAGVGWVVSPVFDDGAALLAATAEQGLEGVVAKRRESRYTPGLRSPDWVKLPHRRTATCVVGGWRPETNGTRLGALLLGVWESDAAGRRVLRFCGRVGSGLAGEASEQVGALLAGRAASSSPFGTAVPRVDAAGARWVEPSLAVEVRFKGATDGGRLREPVFLGVRADAEM